jgi:8-oxo-dGTP pyrophosphatase MutT (NUDIX family)
MKKSRPAPGAARAQVAAMPVRRAADGGIEILLVTSRATKRWIVPKGWRMKGMKDYDAAAREAYEEAGVVGKIAKKPAGRYRYWKRFEDHLALCEATLYLLEVEHQLPDWAERDERHCQWFRPEDAADLVDEPELGRVIRALAAG